jgi:hypothetical protein
MVEQWDDADSHVEEVARAAFDEAVKRHRNARPDRGLI